MPMTAFLLQDIPADVADHVQRVARSTRRGVNEVLVEMLARAAAQPGPATGVAVASVPMPTTAAAVAPDPSSDRAPETAQTSISVPTSASAAATSTPADSGSESLALLEAMQAAKFIPSG